MDEATTGYFSKLPGNSLSHAYITGMALAERLALAVVCSAGGARPCMSCAHCDKGLRHIHPDISFLEKPEDKRDIVVEQIRELKKDVLVVPNEASKKAYVIKNADVMNTAAQNALLTILEEPPGHVVFILSTENHMALLPTVQSRCVKLSEIPAQRQMDDAVKTLAADYISAIYSGNLAIAEIMFRLESLEKSELITMINITREKIAETFLAQANDETLSKSLIKTEKMLRKANEYLDFNVGTGHVAGLMCASLVKHT